MENPSPHSAPLLGSISKKHSPIQQFLTYTFFLFFFFVFILSIRSWMSPTIGRIDYTFEGGLSGSGSNPLFVKSIGKNVDLSFTLDLPFGTPTSFYVKPDDCMEVMTINRQEVDKQLSSFCDYSVIGRLLDLSPYLKKGANSVKIHIKDTGGLTGIRITPSYANSLFFWLQLAIIAALSLYFWATIKLFVKDSAIRQLWLIFLGGALLRTIYFLATPPSVRGNDIGAHVDYIRYVAEHFSIPPASEGWEFHQAPLYYFLSAIWIWIGKALSIPYETALRLIQFQSLVISIGMLSVGLWLATLLFPKQEQRGRLLFLVLLASFPSLIYQSVSTNNNTLYLLFAFLLLALLIRWWREGSSQDWYLIVFTFAFSFLVRVSTLVFAPVIALSLLLHKKIAFREKVPLAIAGLLLFILLDGWLPILRFGLENNTQNSFTFGSQHMNYKLDLGLRRSTFLVFNPIKVVQIPFVSPWRNETRRQYFWEYFFRTAFFGEFGFSTEMKGLAMVILMFALGLVPFCFYGLWHMFSKRSFEYFPLALSFLFLSFSHLYYRIYAPFSSNQDFRFSLSLLPILLLCTVWGIYESPARFQKLGIYLSLALSSACTALVAMLILFPT